MFNHYQKKLSLFAAAFTLGMLSVFPLNAANKQAASETQIQYLSGKGSDSMVQWDFMCTDGRNSGKWSKIGVPSCWEQQGFGTYNYGVLFYGKATAPGIPTEQGMYKYNFKVPEAWRGQRVRIVFEASMTDTEVRVNGKKVGVHQGAFYTFRYDVTDRLFYGGKDNLLEVTVSKESANPSVNLAERRADYWNFGGIFRPVYLEALPVQFIDRTALKADMEGTFRAEVYLGDGAPKGAKVVAQVTDINGKPIGKSFETEVREGGDKAILSSHFDNVKLWSAETPNLYKVNYTLYAGDNAVHTVTEKFGFRTFEIRKGDGLYLNGQRIMVRGVNRHSFRPESGRTLNRTANYEDVKLIKSMNMNTVRLSHYPADPAFYEACDELGLYVMSELGGWHGKYDTGIGKVLVGEMVTRDVNHPSVVFWSNGNEGGWNTELDGEFAKWDPQNRPVIHPQGNLNGLETMHYRSYGETQEYLRGKDVFMPTEFLHGLYDGGHGAGLYDYWEMMRKHPRSGGGILWVLADEGVARADQNGRIDNYGNYAADGIVGPHHEKEGSYNTIRQVWSPVQIFPDILPNDFKGVLQVENRYDFDNLKDCRFKWSLAKFASPMDAKNSKQIVDKGEFDGPNIAAHGKGEIKLGLPGNWRDADVLYVTAIDPQGMELFTWSWSWKPKADYLVSSQKGKVDVKEEKDKITATVGATELVFDKKTGELAGVKQAGKTISFGNGPRFVAARRGDRSLDGYVDINIENTKSVDRIYNEIKYPSNLTSFTSKMEGENLVMEAKYFGAMNSVKWTLSPDGKLRLDYQYGYDGVVELMGVKFDYPEENMQAIRWLGKGPYRVWQNRLHGTTLDVYDNTYNDPIPGESFTYPEFKGYFNDWRWANFTTKEGHIIMANEKPGSYLGVYTPRDGRDALLYTLPQTGLAVFDVIPAVRNKVNATDLVGPSSQAKQVSGPQNGTIFFRFQ
jgi:Beta-galactosidase/beta-glucuronidase